MFARFPDGTVSNTFSYDFHCEVDPQNRSTLAGDGSALEQQALIVAVPLQHALELIRAGELEDTKTEIALRRLGDVE
jgi:ADP-ribose pyrophosphatase